MNFLHRILYLIMRIKPLQWIHILICHVNMVCSFFSLLSFSIINNIHLYFTNFIYFLASVHPCQHAAAMLNIIRALKDCGATVPSVEQYLFIFLKFIQSMVPTIEYDYTIDVQISATTKD